MKRFGWLPDAARYDTPRMSIAPETEFDPARAGMSIRGSENGWLYAPSSDRDPSGSFQRFELPPTHILTISGTSDDETHNFIITFFGWLHGLRLVPKGWGHFYRVAIKRGALVDFVCSGKNVPRLLELAERFWIDHQTDGAAKTLFGALHWYLFCQSYYHAFERFLAQYMVLDTLHETHRLTCGRRSTTHAARVKFLSGELGLELPAWGRVIGKDCELSKIRNELVHESKFAGEPIGFAVTSRETNILLGLQAFNGRLIAAIVGAHGAYSRSSSETQQVHGFDLD
jgi:hypothetical protein